MISDEIHYRNERLAKEVVARNGTDFGMASLAEDKKEITSQQIILDFSHGQRR